MDSHLVARATLGPREQAVLNQSVGWPLLTSLCTWCFRQRSFFRSPSSTCLCVWWVCASKKGRLVTWPSLMEEAGVAPVLHETFFF